MGAEAHKLAVSLQITVESRAKANFMAAVAAAAVGQMMLLMLLRCGGIPLTPAPHQLRSQAPPLIARSNRARGAKTRADSRPPLQPNQYHIRFVDETGYLLEEHFVTFSRVWR